MTEGSSIRRPASSKSSLLLKIQATCLAPKKHRTEESGSNGAPKKRGARIGRPHAWHRMGALHGLIAELDALTDADELLARLAETENRVAALTRTLPLASAGSRLALGPLVSA